MFKRSGVSRSLHAPRGTRITELDRSPRMKRKLWSSPKVRSAASEGVLTHKPLILKEGFLYKPGFFKLTGRKRRWCVLRTYSQTEASIDIYTDETKSRFKGTISLDKDSCPILMVKNYDKKKRSPKNVNLVLKIGKRTYQFMADSLREVKEWSALMRQAIDNGSLFSGKITEPLTIEDGMVNLKFNSNCIAVICPIKENAIKTWRLNHITSFGQCGGNLTFECCPTCSDPGTSRCSISVVQEKPTIILNLMEKAIRSNPNTSEIHYERSILGDIYHCDHECGQPQRLFPAFSDPNLFRSASESPQKDVMVPIDIHEFEIPFSTLSSGKSNDSGLPGTPPLQQDILSLNGSNIPSPSEMKSNMQYDHLGHGNTPYSSISITPPMLGRNMTEMTQDLEENNHAHRKSRETDPQVINKFSRHSYTDIKTTSSSPRHNRTENNVQYTSIQLGPRRIDSPSRDRRLSQQKLEPVDENDGIYDTPNCEPPYWEIANGVLTPLMIPSTNSKMDSSNNLAGLRKSIAHSTSSIYTPGSDLKERDEDFEDLPPVPSRLCRMRPARPPVKEAVVIKARYNQRGRSRLHSTGDVLESVHQSKTPKLGSMDNLAIEGRANLWETSRDSRNDLLTKLHEQDEILTRVLARSRNERNEELDYVKDEGFNRPYKFPSEDYDYELDSENHFYGSPTNSTYNRSGRSSSSSDRGIERVLTKVASTTVRGYAYKIQIPQSNSEYDVPRRAAPAPDLANLKTDAPPKPLRYTITSADHQS